MTEVIEQVEVDVDLDLAVPCEWAKTWTPEVELYTGLGRHCPAPAVWRVLWTCGCIELYCSEHLQWVLGWERKTRDPAPDRILCNHHKIVVNITRTEKL